MDTVTCSTWSFDVGMRRARMRAASRRACAPRGEAERFSGEQEHEDRDGGGGLRVW